MSFLVEVHWRHFGPKHLILAGQIPQESKNRDIGGILAIFAENCRFFAKNRRFFAENRRFLVRNRRFSVKNRQFSAKTRRLRHFPASGGVFRRRRRRFLSTLGGTVATKCILDKVEGLLLLPSRAAAVRRCSSH